MEQHRKFKLHFKIKEAISKQFCPSLPQACQAFPPGPWRVCAAHGDLTESALVRLKSFAPEVEVYLRSEEAGPDSSLYWAVSAGHCLVSVHLYVFSGPFSISLERLLYLCPDRHDTLLCHLHCVYWPASLFIPLEIWLAHLIFLDMFLEYWPD